MQSFADHLGPDVARPVPGGHHGDVRPDERLWVADLRRRVAYLCQVCIRNVADNVVNCLAREFLQRKLASRLVQVVQAGLCQTGLIGLLLRKEAHDAHTIHNPVLVGLAPVACLADVLAAQQRRAEKTHLGQHCQQQLHALGRIYLALEVDLRAVARTAGKVAHAGRAVVLARGAHEQRLDAARCGLVLLECLFVV